MPPDNQAQSIARAVAAAQTARKVIIFGYDDGTEGSDRGGSNQGAGLLLPGYQNDLIQAGAAANPNTVVVLNTGDPVLMPWAPSVRSILEMWYPGQQGGQATADVLLGQADPGGKLPVASTSYRIITGMAVNGIFEGYRWYDQHNVAPLYPFGYGLSYTRFAYSGLQVRRTADGGLGVSFPLSNTGPRAGSDVPQGYLGPSPNLPAGIQQASTRAGPVPARRTRPGRSAVLTLHVAVHDLSSWSSAQQAWVVGTGQRGVWVGPSSRDLPLHTTATVTTH